MNFQTATHSQLIQEGYTVTKLRSQIGSRRRKSLFGVRPSINNAGHNSAKSLKNADEVGTGKIRG